MTGSAITNRECRCEVDVTTYDFAMLPALRDSRGRPAAPMRVLAVLIVLGMLAIAAPALVVLARWTVDTFF